jgi:Rieske Fe-S protein
MDHNRRHFLKSVISTLGAFMGGYLIWGAHRTLRVRGPEEKDLSIGTVDELFAQGNRTVILSRILVCVDTDSLRAVDSYCTHQGCRLMERGERFFCPCHRGEFSREGRVVSGPPTQNLPRYQIWSSRGEVYVDLSRTIPLDAPLWRKS